MLEQFAAEVRQLGSLGDEATTASVPVEITWLALGSTLNVACVPIPMRPSPATLSAPVATTLLNDKNFIFGLPCN
jgi:hypothetical protein